MWPPSAQNADSGKTLGLWSTPVGSVGSRLVCHWQTLTPHPTRGLTPLDRAIKLVCQFDATQSLELCNA